MQHDISIRTDEGLEDGEPSDVRKTENEMRLQAADDVHGEDDFTQNGEGNFPQEEVDVVAVGHDVEGLVWGVEKRGDEEVQRDGHGEQHGDDCASDGVVVPAEGDVLLDIGQDAARLEEPRKKRSGVGVFGDIVVSCF